MREEMLGETPCSVEIPKNSDLIQDGRIEFTFCLPDGREKKRVVDLHGRKPTNPLAEGVAAPFLLGGIGLLWLAGQGADKDDTTSSRADTTEHKDFGQRACSALLGVGTLGIGMGLHALLGGDTNSLHEYPVFVDFNEPPERPAAPAPRTGEEGL